MATQGVGTPIRCASSSVAVRIVAMQTAGESGRRFPAAGPGKSTRSTATPTLLTAWSIATSPEWSRRALAPGVSTRPAGPDPIIDPSLPLGLTIVTSGVPQGAAVSRGIATCGL
jgi:hypothetical protein